MADVAEGQGTSKSARRRQAKKAKEAAEADGAEEEAPPAPAPKAKGKAKAEPKAEAKAEPKAKAKSKAQPKAEAKAEAKAEPKAKSKAEATPEPKAEEPKAKSKAKAKQKAAKPKEEDEEVVQETERKKSDDLVNWTTVDDGSGEWEMCTGMTKKQQKRKERQDEDKALRAAQMKMSGGAPPPQNWVPGMAPLDPRAAAALAAKNKADSSQAVTANISKILASGTQPVEAKPPSSFATITVPQDRLGVVIGPKGSTIKLIQEKTKANLDTEGGMVTVTGSAAAVSEAQAAIKELIEKGYCSLLYEDFSENSVNVHPSYFPDIIGVKGAIIQQIKGKLKVEVNIPKIPTNPQPGKKFKVLLAGTAKAVEEAKDVINSIMMYGHHELTHEGLVHEELEIEPWSYRYIIGKGGSEMKHIQKNWDVKVIIPREHNINQKVLVVGLGPSVERAKTYIEKVIWDAENQVRGGRDKVDNDDGWGGDDDEEEPWMKAYIYKGR